MKYEPKFTEEELAKERWLPVVGWEGLYEVSDLGRARSCRRLVPKAGRNGCKQVLTIRERILRQIIVDPGYPSLALCRNGKATTYRTHRLVASAFLGDRDGMCVNHLDGTRNNNRASNLEWCSHKENSIHARDVLRTTVGENAGGAKLTDKQAAKIRALRLAGEPGWSVARQFGVSQATVSNILSGKTWRHIA